MLQTKRKCEYQWEKKRIHILGNISRDNYETGYFRCLYNIIISPGEKRRIKFHFTWPEWRQSYLKINRDSLESKDFDIHVIPLAIYANATCNECGLKHWVNRIYVIQGQIRIEYGKPWINSFRSRSSPVRY